MSAYDNDLTWKEVQKLPYKRLQELAFEKGVYEKCSANNAFWTKKKLYAILRPFCEDVEVCF